MALSTAARQRRPTLPSSSSDQDLWDRNYSKYKKKSKDKTKSGVGGGDDEGRGISWVLPVLALGILRHMSASSNSVHDCDEVFNYWEPLHCVLYDSGFQTWEYSSQFALRSYLYIFFHTLVARPAAWFFNEEKVRVFYAVRLFLGLISTITESVLVVALSRMYGKRVGTYTLAMLCLTSGGFFASTSSVLCVGREWHRYPSSFFIPSYISEVRWIDDPFQFNLGRNSISSTLFQQ